MYFIQLRDLLNKEKTFVWTADQENVLIKLKTTIFYTLTLGFLLSNVKKQVTLSVDACQHSIRAVFHKRSLKLIQTRSFLHLNNYLKL